jgi:hypothetical protein
MPIRQTPEHARDRIGPALLLVDATLEARFTRDARRDLCGGNAFGRHEYADLAAAASAAPQERQHFTDHVL